MGVGQRLEIRHSQSLVMTPQLQQAIKLLQLSNLELADYCEAELERNPLLERDESAPKDGERETVEPQAKAGERADESLAREDFSKVEDLDTSAHENLYDGENASAAPAGANEKLADWSGVRGGARFEGDEDLLESAVAGGGSLKDHLEQQLAIAALDRKSVVEGKRVDLGGRRIIKKKTHGKAADAVPYLGSHNTGRHNAVVEKTG